MNKAPLTPPPDGGEDLGINDKVTLLEVPEFYRFVNERYDVVVPHDPEQAKKLFVAHFPADEAGIETYFYYLLNYRKVLPELNQTPDISVGEFLDQHISNSDLKLILLGNLGYFHDDPYSISLQYYIPKFLYCRQYHFHQHQLSP